MRHEGSKAVEPGAAALLDGLLLHDGIGSLLEGLGGLEGERGMVSRGGRDGGRDGTDVHGWIRRLEI